MKKKEVQSFLCNLELYWEINNYIFLHGGFISAKPKIKRISVEELIWAYNIPEDYSGKCVIRGHRPCAKPEINKNNININTLGKIGKSPGYLTGLILNDEDKDQKSFVFINKNGKTFSNLPF
jgi:serine/threonine protein phosphatase 1